MTARKKILVARSRFIVTLPGGSINVHLLPHQTQTETAGGTRKTLMNVPVVGGSLLVSKTGHGPKTVLALHGVAGSRLTVEQLAGPLDSSYTFLAPDLRGRGASSTLPGPYGLKAHAADCERILDELGIATVVVVGHSMGALVAEQVAVRRPQQVRGLVLIDGGVVPPVAQRSTAGDIEHAIDSVVGPILENLRRTYATEEEYFDVWRAHPAFQSVWNEGLIARFRYDLEGRSPAFRSRISPEAIKQDMVDALTGSDALAALLRRVRCPMHMVRATRGILDQPAPMISDTLAHTWTAELPLLKDTVIPDTNHISVTLLESAKRQIATFIEELSGE